MIELRNVKKFYGGRCVLNLPLLRLREGGKYALIGANGSGKSTLLRILSGALLPDEGNVSIPNELRENRGSMPQSSYAFGLSALANVALALPKASDSKERARNALERVGLGRLLQTRGSALSGGEAQRMAFARMIVRPRRLLLLDEPSSAMDVAGSELMEEILKDYCLQCACTLVFATHSPAQARRLADEAMFMHGGQVTERAPAEDFFKSAQTSEARSFLRHWLPPRTDI